MVTKVFNKPDRLVRLLRIEKKKPVLKPANDVFINQTHPFSDDNFSRRYAVEILVNVI